MSELLQVEDKVKEVRKVKGRWSRGTPRDIEKEVNMRYA